MHFLIWNMWISLQWFSRLETHKEEQHCCTHMHSLHSQTQMPAGNLWPWNILKKENETLSAVLDETQVQWNISAVHIEGDKKIFDNIFTILQKSWWGVWWDSSHKLSCIIWVLKWHISLSGNVQWFKWEKNKHNKSVSKAVKIWNWRTKQK